MPVFWLSYSDDSRPADDRHLHIIVAADTIGVAVELARGLGAIGEVSVADLDDCNPLPPAEFMNRVLADADIDSMEAAIAAIRSKAAALAAIHAVLPLPRISGDTSARRPCIEVYKSIQVLLRASEFSVSDVIIASTIVTTMQPVVIVGLARYCFMSRMSSPSLQTYVGLGYAELARRDRNVDSMMAGLWSQAAIDGAADGGSPDGLVDGGGFGGSKRCVLAEGDDTQPAESLAAHVSPCGWQ